jgi:ATP-binding cassette subfamily F protein 3
LANISQADLGYGGKKILSQVNFDLQPGTRVGLLGPNGAGKSTLISSLTGDIKLISGAKVYGENVKIGYFAQHQLEVLDLQASPFLHLQRISPKATDQEIRNFLGGFDFHNDKALDPIKDFSGGEKARLALAIIVWQKPNLLLLDEPTNHLDLEMRQALTMALQGYDGALVVISHDRHLLRNTVDQFFLVAEGRVEEFDGDLKDYQSWLKNFSRDTPVLEQTVVESAVDKKLARQQSAESRKKIAPLKKEVKTIELKIEKQQKKLADLEDKLADTSIYEEGNKQKLKTTLADQAEVKKLLSDLEESWLEKQELIESFAE